MNFSKQNVLIVEDNFNKMLHLGMVLLLLLFIFLFYFFNNN